jgi:trehalose 2-sulfotransferase
VPRSTYIVASTPRTGSTLLCEGLEATGVAGRPAEVFAPDFMGMWEEYWSLPEGSTFDEFLQAALAYGTTPNGVYGLKIHWSHVLLLAERLAVADDLSRVLEALFPDAAYINIVRRDRRAQALSFFRALGTNEWCRFVGTVAADATQLELDHDMVRSLEAEMKDQQRGWMQYFSERGIEPLVVEYERLESDYRGEIARALAFLGFDPAAAASIPEPRLVRQSDDLNATWYQEMRSANPVGS